MLKEAIVDLVSNSTNLCLESRVLLRLANLQPTSMVFERTLKFSRLGV